MPTYTAIALLSLLGITLSANAAQAFETKLPKSDTATAQEMLSTQTQQWRRDPPPQRGGGRR
ncbi:heterocyst-inhibiting protein PatX [Microcoleus sp. OTE_8_concoct_300]|uniref:heterocyst-inhibiting protein PatX n=1 Tax=Microcoleus sp. OTE_8_concoct_300 TaxID=2964710 RepID=UPI00403F64E8